MIQTRSRSTKIASIFTRIHEDKTKDKNYKVTQIEFRKLYVLFSKGKNNFFCFKVDGNFMNN